MEWYYSKNGQQLGPVPIEAVRQLIAQGQITHDDLVWREGMSNWQPMRAVAELTPMPPAPPTIAPPRYGAPPIPGMPAAPPIAPPPPVSVQPLNGNYAAQPFTPQQQSFRGMATASMILGIVGLLCGGIILGPIAIVFAAIAHSNMRRTGNIDGKGMATAGLILGIVSVVFGVLGIFHLMFSFHHFLR